MDEQEFNKEKHIKYWQRCLKTLLPTQYTTTDSSRTLLGFFILAALDLLGAGAETFPAHQRTQIRDWLLKCQHPNGGFCGSPNHRYPDKYYVDTGYGKEQMDPANLPATYFAMLSLSFVGGLERVKRREALEWLRKLQREDGSFGELVTGEGNVEGGRDMRPCYSALAVRWLLRGEEVGGGKDDIDVEKLVGFLRAGQTYDGGFSESSEHEAHAGYTYCAIGSLSLLHRLPDPSAAKSSKPQIKYTTNPLPGLANLPTTIRWLISRQIEYFPEQELDEDSTPGLALEVERNANDPAEQPSLNDLSLQDNYGVGFNGRTNKRVDTCYAFWVTASLDMIGQAHLVDANSIRRFLFEQTQHQIGGFGKCPGNPPDIYHSYLGLAALATMKEPGLKEFDPVLCISKQQRKNIDRMRKDGLAPKKIYWKHGYSFLVREDDPGFENKMASNEKAPEPLVQALDVERPSEVLT